MRAQSAVDTTRQQATHGTELAFLAVSGSPYLALVMRRVVEHFAPFHSVRLLRLVERFPLLEERLYWARRAEREPALVWFRNSVREIARMGG